MRAILLLFILLLTGILEKGKCQNYSAVNHTFAPGYIDSTPFQNVLMIIADTGENYHLLRNKMLALSTQLALEIDTLGRYYNEEKKEIVLSEADADKMYAGYYFPRRDITNTLSLEYLYAYIPDYKQNTIALVAAICDKQSEADLIFNLLKQVETKAFILQARVFIGCMH